MRRATEARSGTVAPVDDAGSRRQRGRDRSAQADADRDGRRSRVVGSWPRSTFGCPVSGHRALEAWARQFGQVARWGVESAAGWGRHTAIFLIGRGYDVRDVCANRTPGLTARVSAASPTRWIPSGSPARCWRIRCCPRRSSAPGQDQGPDEQHQLLALWHNRRRSILTSRQHLVGEAEYLLCELPLELREQLPDSKAVRPGWQRSQRRNRRRRYDPPTRLRLQLLDGYRAQIQALDREEKQVVAHCDALVDQQRLDAGRALRPVHPVGRRAAGRGRRPPPLHRGRLRRFNGTAPLPASTAEGPGEPVRHRYNPGGNRRINAVLHRMAVTQLRCEPRAQRIYANARANGHTKKEARRVLKRHLSDVVYRRMIRDLAAQSAQPLLAA